MSPLAFDTLGRLIDRLSQQTAKPQVVISSCLAGQAVRYDGTDKKLEGGYDRLAQELELIPFCPEMAAGMGAPRDPIRRVLDDAGEITLRWVENHDIPLDDAISNAAYSWLIKHRLVAAILKARSPSCGSGSTPIYNECGEVIAIGDGVFTQTLKEQQGVCVVDEAYFTDSQQCNWFILGCYLFSLDMTINSKPYWMDNLACFLELPAAKRAAAITHISDNIQNKKGRC